MGTPRGHKKGMTHRLRNPIRVIGSFTVDAVPAVDDPLGRGFTVARTALGIYTITFADAAAVLYSATASCSDDAGGAALDLIPQFGAWAAGAAPTLVVRTKTAAAQAELAVGDRCWFDVTLYGEAIDR